jgi:polysaccharide biosynthesis protein PslG
LRHHRFLAFLAACAVAVAACAPTAPPTPTAKSEAKPKPKPSPEPTPVVASPTVRRVENGKVDSPSPTVHVFLWGNPDTTDRDLKLAKDAGFTWVKQRFEWRYIEKERDDAFEWNEPDRVVDAINKAGLGIVARMDNQPEWARADQIFPASGPPDNLDDWEDFLEDFVNRYKGKIQAYEIWNEPNLAREWGGVRPDARAYTELLRVSYQTIKKADPQALVISAGLSPTTEQSDNAIADVVYLREMYNAGAYQYFDVLGVHAPGFKASPEMDPAQVAQSPELTNNDPSAEELKRAYTFRHVEDIRKIMVENNDQDRQIAIMEMGWTSDQRPNSPYAWHGVTEEQKADYLARAFRYAAQNWTPWIGQMTVIYIPDPNWTASEEQYYWSITNPDGTQRPAWGALQGVLPSITSQAATARPSASPSPSPGALASPSPSPAP